MKKLNIYLVLICGLLFLGYSNVFAVPASPYPIKIQQPDGTTLNVLLKGDEFYHYKTTEDGYVIAKGENGVYNYAIFNNDGTLRDTRVKANDKGKRNITELSFVSSLTVNPPVNKFNQMMRAKRNVISKTQKSNVLKSNFPLIGSPKSLVILVNFADVAYVTSTPQAAFTSLLNEPGYSTNGGTGSARDYFRDNSTGVFNPEFDVVGPYTLPNDMIFYGGNDKDGNDTQPLQMIVDACKLAHDAGIDFRKYDTDNDGVVDNVFVYYAGHNEAEWGGANTIWPHRWGIYPTAIYNNNGNYNGTVQSVTFDGKRVEDYACTSELKGSSGSGMCGIGTFTHEFGHVLGLPDFYATNGATHHTLSYWDIMDAGPYLNQGRTPPAYSSYERFFLKWLVPTMLKNTQNQLQLNSITTSNQAFLISPTDLHNLNGQNPNPVEFFLLENRQKAGWDAYLPGHGLLISRIFYNSTDWNYNQPNNDPNKMGDDIIEADQINDDKTLSGDPFPGTSKVTLYEPKLRSGASLGKNITAISENNGVISFYYSSYPPPVTIDATYNSYKSFVANWKNAVDNDNSVSGYYLTVFSTENAPDTTFIVKNKWVTSKSDTIQGLISGRNYYYLLKSSYKTGSSEVITNNSNITMVKTLPYPKGTDLRIAVNNGSFKVFVPTKNATVDIYNMLGQKLRTYENVTDILEVKDLPKNTIYIVQSGNYRKKIIL